MYTLSVELGNPKDPRALQLEWNVGGSFLSLLWIKGFVTLSQQKKTLFPRPTGFLSPLKDWRHLQIQLNQAIALINQDDRYRIPETGFEKFSQEFSNQIHHHFEVLIGPIEKPTEFYNQSSPNVKRAVGLLNHLIHDMEALHRSEQTHRDGGVYSAALITECINPRRLVLPPQGDSEFSLKTEFGDLCLHYSQIGKTWWEVFLDQDEEIFPEAIRPLNYISGEFDVFFQDFEPSASMTSDLNHFLKEHGQNPSDPSLRLGYVNVGKLKNQNFTQPQVLQNICKNLIFNKARLHRGNELVAEVHADHTSYSYSDLQESHV